MAIPLHEAVLDFISDFHTKHPSYLFWMRSRDRGSRLTNGYWFQGREDYAFVGLYKAAGGTNMTRSIGLVFEPNSNDYLLKFEVVFNNEQNSQLLALYRDILKKFGPFKQIGPTKYQKVLGVSNGFALAEDFLLNQKPKLDSLVQSHNLSRIFLDANTFRSQLQTALDSRKQSITSTSIIHHKIVEQIKMKHSFNTILYGPPGTGKTYHTISKAVELANPDYILQDNARPQIKEEYNRLVKEGQIEFVTFHQSMSYEDFIEGIKPLEPKKEDAFLKYDIQDGIFKLLVQRATYIPDVQTASVYLSDDEFSKAAFYSLNLNSNLPEDKVIYRFCSDNGFIALNVADGIDVSGLSETAIKQKMKEENDLISATPLNKFIHHLKVGDYVIITDGANVCRAIGQVTSAYEFKPNEGITPDHFRKVKWIVKDVQIPREELYESQFAPLIERLDKEEVKKDFFTKKQVAVQPKLTRKNYVLIIDEINRGNVSQIFGELITLIEEDKRSGKEEALSITLPYSKKVFTVPDNLYIIGTMNTADRSVEALDTALRRRFVFEEKKPLPNLLSPQRLIWKLWWTYSEIEWNKEPYKSKEIELYNLLGIVEDFDPNEKIWKQMKREGFSESQISYFDDVEVTGVNLQILLETINERLTALLTRDHTIGHAWLMDVNSLDDLQSAFKNKILPLLQEYFYNNYAKIGLVLGDKFVTQRTIKKAFANFTDVNQLADEYEGNVLYFLADPFQLNLEDFKSIYQ